MAKATENQWTVNRGRDEQRTIEIWQKIDGVRVPYQFVVGDKLYLSVKRTADNKLVIDKEFVTKVLYIEPKDTESLEPSDDGFSRDLEKYKYDLYLTPKDTTKKIPLVRLSDFIVVDTIKREEVVE